MASPRYREDKATQTAALLLRLRGGTMSYLKLIKLLYLVDREALIRWGRPVTYDPLVCMPHGPALSLTLDRINSEVPPEGPSYWQRYISPRSPAYEVHLLDDSCPVDQLSPAEESLIREIFDRYGHWTRWEMRDFTHTLPEWRDPKGSSIDLPVADVLRAAGVEANEILAIEEELDGIALADQIFAE